MSKYFTEQGSAETVIARLNQCQDARTKQIMEAMIRHLHDFVKEVEPTMDEWMTAIQFLTATGQMCDDKRQEWILASDTLGVSMLVDAINNRRPSGATENTVLGPFHVEGAPFMDMGSNICLDGKGAPCVISGVVTDTDGNPVEGAVLDVWQTNDDGFYDVQQPGVQPDMNLRGRFKTGPDGTYSFVTVKPIPYPIPTDGPVGQMLEITGRHGYRPAHVHFIVSAPGYEPVTTHIFAADSDYLDSDAVFGVKEELIVDFEKTDDGWAATYDFGLVKNG